MEKYNNIKPEELLGREEQIGYQKNTKTEILNELKRLMATNETGMGYCKKATNEGDMIIDLGPNIIGHIPREEVTYEVKEDGKVHKGKAQQKVGLNVIFKVKEIKELENGEVLVELSRKEAVEEIRNKYASELKVGMVVTGVVTGMQEYGAFIDIGGDVSGILSVADITRVYIKHPAEVLKKGDEVKVMVSSLEVDSDNNIKITFNREKLLPGWEIIDSRYQKGETVLGRIKNIIDTGIFVELDESFEGLAEFVPNRKYQYGEKVRVKIESINKEKEKIKLRIID